MNANTSLDQLHDLVMPPTIAWWPPALGWYVIAIISFIALCVAAVRWYQQWRKNAYRRMAVREWEQIAYSMHGHEQIVALAELLKRTALAAFPRQDVASLTGDAWLRFLDRASRQSHFDSDIGRSLVAATYDARINQIGPATVDAVREWIVRHQVPQAAK